MKLGMVGLPNVGKSTLFNAITNAGAASANYPFCTIEANVGVVSVPDPRLDLLAEVYQPDKFTPAVIEFMDIAGLVRGASKGEGLGNKFLADIREVDAVVHVVRCFADDDIVHVDGNVNAIRDVETINLELVFADIEVLNRRIDKASKMMKADKKIKEEFDMLNSLKSHLENGLCARSFDCSIEDKQIISTIPLLSNKPVIYCANVSEKDFTDGIENNPEYQKLCDFTKNENAAVLPICARTEQELADMEPEDRLMLLNELGLAQSGLDRMIQKCYELLGLISFLTAGKQEVRAWTITKGTKAPAAAGKIHTDFEKGFIRAEVTAYSDFAQFRSMATLKEKGLVRLEGKEYVMADGDIVLFRFNV